MNIVSVEIIGCYGFWDADTSTIQSDEVIAAIIEEDGEFSIYEPWEFVRVCDLLGYLNNPANDCKGSSTGSFPTRADAERYQQTIEML